MHVVATRAFRSNSLALWPHVLDAVYHGKYDVTFLQGQGQGHPHLHISPPPPSYTLSNTSPPLLVFLSDPPPSLTPPSFIYPLLIHPLLLYPPLPSQPLTPSLPPSYIPLPPPLTLPLHPSYRTSKEKSSHHTQKRTIPTTTFLPKSHCPRTN